ncbi:major facilitator superfamily MFS_1 [Pseudarthrobacter chlorophenolicus A6]|uniref:Major facilitator superfamily MFS_1 n=1 Tax=Pseudarthrobacter chlorophenolicus (strain ATCC 700700 / DSM 12829 / CIP 107037 / JCM 12360 / KCTC 9906 / NCIMB 13794 / A6) TaxID=452863 RepID=B8H8D3_PSECP|nr:MFS transporter [Pseudarthrobacter chlorophenolicus]ACL38107.1 major facilitator superfamily MFS_1 [Pseudarthrobacter chlorophenolicus A6]SDQ55138.1 Predicted arabinose efflux permease, MFS family [Pseudarthrobacter chlorophenolicus]
MIGELGRRSATALLLHSALIQAVTFLVRPAATYRALELDVPGFALGLLAASYAVFPLLLAVPTGGLVDRLGERRLMAIGSGVVLACSAFLLFWGSSITALVIGTAFLGAGQLACVVGQQAVVANNAAASRMDSAFGYLTFAASLGQALGPLAISLVGGNSIQPDTNMIFLLAVVMSAVLFLDTFLVSAEVSGGTRKAGEVDGGKGSAIALLKTPGVARALATSATVLAVVDLTMVYLPALGTDRGLTAATVGAMLTVRAVFSMVSRLLLGRVSRRIGRMRLLVTSLALSTAALAAAAIPMPAWLLFVVMAVLGLGLGIGQPLTMSWLSSQAPAGQRGRALALRLAGNRVGQVVLPSAIGVVAAGLGAAGVFLASAVVVGGSMVLLRGVKLD